MKFSYNIAGVLWVISALIWMVNAVFFTFEWYKIAFAGLYICVAAMNFSLSSDNK